MFREQDQSDKIYVSRDVLQPMVNGQPESVRLARQVGVVNAALSLPG